MVMCMAGNKGVSDQLNRKLTSVMVALTMNWKFHYSNNIFQEMLGNLKGSKKHLFMMYPRSIQMILDARYQMLEMMVENLDVKMLSQGVFGLTRHSRKDSKVVYQELYQLEIFGDFAEIEGVENVNAPTAVHDFADEEYVNSGVQNQEVDVEFAHMVISNDEDEIVEELYADVNIPAPVVDVTPRVYNLLNTDCSFCQVFQRGCVSF